MIFASSEYLCSAGGRFCSHSIEFLVCVEKSTCRLDEILSQIMNKNIITLTKVVADPIDEIMFHVVKASG
jgi:hypothetical protein